MVKKRESHSEADVVTLPAVHRPHSRRTRRLARPLQVERECVVSRVIVGSHPLDRFERAVMFAMQEASRMKVERT